MNDHRGNRSPWEIGHDHWDQRDLYTRNPRTDDSGYARGPSEHPDIGSYAYVREFHVYEAPDPREAEQGPPISIFEHYYEHEAWPCLTYHDEENVDGRALEEGRVRARGRARADHGEGIWERVSSEASELKDRLIGGAVSVAPFSRHSRHHRDVQARKEIAGEPPDDDTIREDVQDALRWHRELDASDVEVSVEQGEVTLRGSVHDPRSKALAAEVAAGCAGVVSVHNRIRVRHDDDSDMDVALVMPLQPV